MGLPQEKKDTLADKVANDVYDVMKRHHKDFTSHEVSSADSHDIIKKGTQKGYYKALEEIAPKKDRP
jgi:hypothetical protein